MHFLACSRSWSIVQSSPATPRIGQFRRPRRSSRYRAWNVITRARSPVMPKTTNTSARWAPAGLEPFVADRVRDRTAVLMGGLSDGGDDDWGANPLAAAPRGHHPDQVIPAGCGRPRVAPCPAWT